MKAKPRVDVVCAMCGNTFQVQPCKDGAHFCSRSCYHQWRSGKSIGGKKIAVSSEAIAQEYRSGSTLRQIADRLGVTAQAVSYHLRKVGQGTRPPDGANLREPEVAQKANDSRRTGMAHPAFVADLPVQRIVRAYGKGKSTAALAKQYKVSAKLITHRLLSAGVRLRRPGFSRYRRCSDGHLVQSHWEQAVDEWLTQHGLPHEVQPPCPWAKWRSIQRADFIVGNTYIEVWGMEGNAKYDKRRLEKIAKYREHGFDLIEVFPHHVTDHDYSPLEILLSASE